MELRTTPLHLVTLFESLRCDRLKFLGKVLSVERATSAPSKDGVPEENATTNEGAGTAPLPPPLPPPTSEAHQSHRREPISPSLGVDYPFPPQLEYVHILLVYVMLSLLGF